MKNEWAGMNIENVGDGEAKRAFDDALQTILADIEDARKDPKGKRSISLKVEFQRGDDNAVAVTVSSTVVLGKRKARRSLALIQEGLLLQHLDTQGELPLPGNVTTFDPAGKAEGAK